MTRRLKKHDLFITQKVGDILFSGYKDELTSNLAKFENFIKDLHRFLPIKIDGPSAISKDGYFSLFGQVRVRFARPTGRFALGTLVLTI